MKYVIKYTTPDCDGMTSQWSPHLYHKYCYVENAGEKIQGSASTKLSEAELFDTYQEAAHIIEQVYSEIANSADKFSQCLKIVGVTKKEMFKAKLADK